ncbi:protein bicaudal C [Lycorma delicatula]|uniref:protein bicaudal C n=1 Tax=Lycorma delicatula TaxID=130591 RepID=UPI003F511513
MSETNTRVIWPSRLKVGSKSHKDPHIRIAGRDEDVKTAKNKIMSVLDIRSNRVTMKLDVSYTDHSHIIGKGGQIIKKVMEETGCHIHFPDSNRNNPLEKSNQVSIAGEIKNVENARARIRELSPLIFTFELPVLGTMQSELILASPYITSIQEKYNVQVKFRTRSKLYSTMVVVKGCEWELSQVEKATLLLVNQMCGSLTSQNQIQMIMEISPQHHPIVRGENDTNLMRIMQLTRTQIVFPDVLNPCISSLKKSNVTITGSIHSVYLARQLLMGSLPLVLIFELGEGKFADADQINMLSHKLDVSIIVRQKPRYNAVTAIIKGIERNASNIYEAYRQLKGSSISRVTADIPSTYNMPSIVSLFNDSVKTKSNQTSMGNQNCQPMIQLNNLLSAQNPHILQIPRDGYLGHLSHSLPDISSATANTSLSSKNSSPQLSPNSVKNSYCGNLPHVVSDLNIDWRAPGFGRRSVMEYQQLKLHAMQARLNEPSPNDIRIPVSTWSGYGFSSSNPAAASGIERNIQDEEDGAWGPAPEQTISNLLDEISSTHYAAISSSQANDIISILTSVDLEKYIPMFQNHEIDLMTFRTLTDRDLKEIGVHALGARRKLLTVIAEINRTHSNFHIGADRKSSSSTNSLNENW